MAASLNNLDSVINHFKDMDCPYFIISEDKKNIFYANSTISNIDEAADKLREKLEDKDHSKPYHIYCFNAVKRGGLSINTKEGAVYFSYQKARPEYNREYSDTRGIYELIRAQNEQINALRGIVMANEESVEDEEIEEEMQPNYMGAIGQILGHPAMQPIISNLLTALASTIVVTKNNEMQPTNKVFQAPQALAGTTVSQEELLTECLENLFNKGVTIEHLQKLAAMPTAKIKMLITML
jgi:hypothetical protein